MSVLIPTLDEAATIGAVLRRAVAAVPDGELIVVDGGSRDETAAIASAHATVLRSAGTRGGALNEASRAARGDVLLFVHADTMLPSDAEAEIVRVLGDARVVGGAFRFAFDDRSRAARAIAAWVNLRSRLFNVFLGDQALFVRKDVFLRAGGFRDWSVMEDFEILGRLRRFGRLRLARSTIATSARRHRRHGWIKTTATVWLVTWLYLAGAPPRVVTAIYRRRTLSRR